MLKFSKLSLLSALLLVASGAQAADAADKSIALVNGVSIPQSRLDMRVKSATAQGGQPDTPELRKAIRDDLITLEVISQAAKKQGLDKQADAAMQIEMATQQVLAGAFVQDYAKSHPISDETLKQDYETMKTRVGNKEYKVSHILVSTEEEAKAVIARLKKDKFAKVAKEKSKDPGSKDNGGDLGWSVPTNYVQPFGVAVTQLAKGQLSAPVQTQFGWHVIKLEDTRDLKVPTFEELKPQLEKRKQQEAIQKAIAEMKDKAKVE